MSLYLHEIYFDSFIDKDLGKGRKNSDYLRMLFEKQIIKAIHSLTKTLEDLFLLTGKKCKI